MARGLKTVHNYAICVTQLSTGGDSGEGWFVVQTACSDDPFQHIATTGEYSLYCRPSVLLESS